MKKLLLLSLIILTSISCKDTSLVTVLYAQTLPVTRTLTWDKPDPSEQITGYTVSLDGIVIGNPTTESQVFTINTSGVHTLSAVAHNLMLMTSAPAILDVNVKITPTKNFKVTN